MNLEIDPKIRFIVLYRDARFSIDRINKITGTSVRTLNFWRQRLEEGHNILDVQEGRGRKKKFTEFFRKIKKETIKHPQRVSTRASGAKFGICRTTTGRILHELRFTYKKIVVKQKLTNDEKKSRIKFCQEILENQDEITESFWADETGVWLSDRTKNKVWALKDQGKFSAPISDVKVNIWAAVSIKGATSLYIYNQNLNGTLYSQILQERRQQMDKLMPSGYYYFHDKSKIHTSKAVNDWAKDNQFLLNLIPVKSSDLNPVENLWAWLKGSVAKDSPRNEAALIRSLNKNWKKVDKDFILPFMTSIRDRCNQCIERKGDYTDY